MRFKKRLAVLEKSARPLNYIPPIIIHIFVKPSEDGPKEVEALLNLQPMELFRDWSAKQMKHRGSLKIAFNHNLNFEKRHV